MPADGDDGEAGPAVARSSRGRPCEVPLTVLTSIFRRAGRSCSETCSQVSRSASSAVKQSVVGAKSLSQSARSSATQLGALPVPVAERVDDEAHVVVDLVADERLHGGEPGDVHQHRVVDLRLSPRAAGCAGRARTRRSPPAATREGRPAGRRQSCAWRASRLSASSTCRTSGRGCTSSSSSSSTWRPKTRSGPR